MRIGPDPFVGRLSGALNVAPKINDQTGNNDGSGKFAEIFRITMTGTSENSQELSAVSRAETAKVLMGTEDNLIDNMVAGEKSSMQFELNLKVRSKILDAYNEIMRTQV